MIDAEGWKHGEQNGLDTRVVRAVNDLHFIFLIFEDNKQML